MKKNLLAFSISLVLSSTGYAAPATTTVTEQATLAAHGGEMDVQNASALLLRDDLAFNYSGDVNAKYTLTTNVTDEPYAIKVYNSRASFGKTDVIVNIDSHVSLFSIGAVIVRGIHSFADGIIRAEFGAGSSFTVNGYGNQESPISGIEAHYLDLGVSDSGQATIKLNENTTITLNNAGSSSRGILAFREGAQVETQDGLLIEMNAVAGAIHLRGITAEGGIGALPSNVSLGGKIVLNGTTTVNILNGSSGTTGVNAYVTGANVSALKTVTINNVTNDSNAFLYGLRASDGGTIDFFDTTNITLQGGSSDSVGVMAFSGSAITVTGADINVDTGHAFAVNGTDATITGNAATYKVNGDMLASNDGAINITMTDGSEFNGATTLAPVPGTIDLTLNGAQSIWNMNADSTLSSLSLNAATLSYNTPLTRTTFTPKTLTVTGNYSGNNGVLVLNTALGDDNSVTDKLIVQGDVTAGTTQVAINNIGGTGAQTIEGIEVIEVGGQSIGQFVQQNRIVAGAYDYTLAKGVSNENWYLTTRISPNDPQDPDAPALILRPEFSSYIANNYAANTLFLMRLHDRLGETQYTDILTGEKKVTSMWMRHIGSHTRFKDRSGQHKTQSNRYAVQIGGDLAQWSTNGLERWHLGLMAGYGNSHSNTSSSVVNYGSRSKVEGYSAGFYGTWYANQADKSGVYLDSWILYNWFDNEVSGDERTTEKYKSRGITASIEGGYSFKLGENENGRDSYWLQPKAQVIWMGVRAKDHYEHSDFAGNRTKVTDDTKGNLQTRLGLRAYINGHSQWDDNQDRQFQPFVEANWIYNTKNYGVKIADVKDEMRGTRHIGEIKVGVEGQLSKRLNVWGNVAQQIGGKGYSDTSATLGIKYHF